MKRLLIVLLLLSIAGLQDPGFADGGPPCVTRAGNNCGGVTADQARGDFHGLIMVPGQDGVLDLAMHSGSKPGCGDCNWTLVLACWHTDPHDLNSQLPCNGPGQSPKCGKGQTLYDLFLSTDTEGAHIVTQLCLGGPQDVVDVSDLAATDVDRYLKDVVPPLMHIGTQPPRDALAGVPTYFQVSSPDPAPQQFGGAPVTETITIKAATYTWNWGDGTAPLKTTDPGAPYPDGTVTHTYVHAAHVSGTLTTEWTATYTVTAGGRTLGPFNATGTVTRTQPFTLTVDRARSHLVSHG